MADGEKWKGQEGLEHNRTHEPKRESLQAAAPEVVPGAEEGGGFRSAEVAAFFGKLNYFRQEIRVRNAADTEWKTWHWYAGDRIVQEALDGKKTIGLRASWTTSFISFDVDVIGKIEKASAGNEDWRDVEVMVGNGVENSGSVAGRNGGGELGKDGIDGGRDSEVEAGDDEEDGRKSGGADREKERAADRMRDERMQAEMAVWAEWELLNEGNEGSGDFYEELGRAFGGAYVPEIEGGKGPKLAGGTGPITMELSLELREAAEIIKSCFTVEPSLAVRSPHGCHLYWCLSEKKYWTVVKGIAQRVKEEAEDQYAEIGIEREIEVLPSPTQALRLPRRDRLLEPRSHEPMGEIKDGEAFWNGLKQYRLEEIVKEEVLERELGEHRRKPYRGPKRKKKREPEEEKSEEEKEEIRARAEGELEGSGTGEHEEGEGAGELGNSSEGSSSGGGRGGGRDGEEHDGDASGNGVDDGDAGEGENDGNDGGAEHGWRRSKKPKNKEEAEEAVMPFRNHETNRQLIAMVEGGKRSGMAVAEITDWVNEWIERSRVEGYTGPLGQTAGEIERRVARLFEQCNVNVGGKKRWIELWESENGKYVRDEGIAERMMAELERVRPLAKQSRPAVLRFMGDLDAWRRIIDDAAGRAPSRLDKQTIENQKRGAYPLPHQLLQKLNSKYREIWEDIQRAGVLAKDTDKGGKYVPNLGRVQGYIYCSIEV